MFKSPAHQYMHSDKCMYCQCTYLVQTESPTGSPSSPLTSPHRQFLPPLTETGTLPFSCHRRFISSILELSEMASCTMFPSHKAFSLCIMLLRYCVFTSVKNLFLFISKSFDTPQFAYPFATYEYQGCFQILGCFELHCCVHSHMIFQRPGMLGHRVAVGLVSYKQL